MSIANHPLVTDKESLPLAVVELFDARKTELYVRDLPRCAGQAFASLVGRFPRAEFVEVVRKEGRVFKPFLNPAGDFVLDADDRLMLLAKAYADT